MTKVIQLHCPKHGLFLEIRKDNFPPIPLERGEVWTPLCLGCEAEGFRIYREVEK